MELKPNVSFPLGLSYDERGIRGFTNISDRDQYKINMMYQPVQNQFTRNTTLYLVNRPGTITQQTFTGSGMLTTYHVMSNFADDPATRYDALGESIVVNSDGTSTRVHLAGSDVSTIFVSSDSYTPTFCGGGFINNADTRVIQLSYVPNLTRGQRVFYATSFALWTEIVSSFSTLFHVGKMEVMDGYAFQLVSTNRIYNSNINTISTWPTGNFITKQIVSDYPVGLVKIRNQLLAFGFDTVEAFYNSGLTPAPLGRIPQLTQNIGLGTPITNAGSRDEATEYYATVDGRVYFNSGFNGAFSYDGARFEKISTPAVDRIFWERQPYSVDRVVCNKEQAVAFRLTDIAATTQRSLMFFPRYNDWFEWRSNLFKTVGNGLQMACVSNYTKSTVVFSSLEKWTDGGSLAIQGTENYTSVIQFKLPSDGTRKQMNTFGVVGDTEVSTTTNQLQVEFSDDDGQSFGSARTIDMTQVNKQLTRCGAFRQRTVRLTHVGNTEIRLEKVIANIK